MIEGTGVDIVEIGRFKKIKYNSKPSFYKKLFRENRVLGLKAYIGIRWVEV